MLVPVPLLPPNSSQRDLHTRQVRSVAPLHTALHQLSSTLRATPKPLPNPFSSPISFHLPSLISSCPGWGWGEGASLLSNSCMLLPLPGRFFHPNICTVHLYCFQNFHKHHLIRVTSAPFLKITTHAPTLTPHALYPLACFFPLDRISYSLMAMATHLFIACLTRMNVP